MLNFIRNFLLRNGLFLFISTINFVYLAPIYTSYTAMNNSDGQTNLVLSRENHTNISTILYPKDIHLLKVSPLNITDGLTIQEKIVVVNYLSAIEQKEEKEHHLITKSTTDNTVPYVFEEDIILTPKQAQIIYESRNPRQKRKLNTDLHRHWQLPIQYAFDGSHNESEKSIIRRALNYWESYTCITFEEITYKDNSSVNENKVYIVFTSNEGCWSFVGRSTYREQKVSIFEDCIYEGHVLHEIGHVIGFWHEHARPDREEHIQVQQNAIQYGKQYNFLHISWKDLDNKDMPYDVGSIMHYGSRAYAVDNQTPVPPTIITKDPLLQRALGQRFQLSFYDVKLANAAYCADKCNNTKLAQPCQHDGYQDPKLCSRCRCTEGLGGNYCETAAPSVGDTCGGVINLTGSSVPIGYPTSYRFGQQCNWYIKAPKNSRVFFTITPPRIMEYPQCVSDTNNKYVECLNYLEVRYSHNIATTGARICCSYLESTKPIISEGNEMLVLLRANAAGSYGFQAKIWAEPCGGCVTGTELSHRPCSRNVPYVCERQWNYTEWNPCPSGNWWWADNKDCNKLVNKTAVRSGICHRSELFCCNGYQLNGTDCIKSSSVANISIVIQPGASSTEYIVPTHDPSKNKENDPSLGNWTTWSNCSTACGGCGNQTRQRLCYDPILCSGKSIEVETRSCNKNPCTQVKFGTRTISKVVVCNPITLQKCTVYEKETYPFISETCCTGYAKNSNGTCAKTGT
ncbi:zinc metalloproteinase dpy-31-like [Mytilus edulis]|uniref:zinc metalloproteinase dpy-31-like n=1 Tax=Mytilus edulis TaxID=6550 RepID=UPI0039F0E9B2